MLKHQRSPLELEDPPPLKLELHSSLSLIMDPPTLNKHTFKVVPLHIGR